MNSVEVRLLRYKFRFRNLTWREELHLTIPPGKNPTRIVLAHALEDVSGLPVKSVEEAAKVFAAMPIPVVSRVYRIYKGLLPASRRFETAGLYRAPDPSVYVKRVAEDDDVVDQASDRVMQRMEQNFSKQELAEAADIDRQILKASKLRGAVKINPEKTK